MKRGRWGKRRRRLSAVALGALALAVLAQFVAPGAGAVVANPGDVNVQMRITVNTPSFKVEGSTPGSARATLSGNGLVNIPRSNLVFAPTPVHIDVPSPPPAAGSTDTLPPISPSSTVVVTIVPTSDFYGGVDPNNGSGFLVGNVKLLWDQTGTLTGCTVGPFKVVARTNEPGARQYDSNSGRVTMVDPGFTLDALPAGAAGCGGYESSLSSALALPVTTTTTTTQPNTPPPLPPSYSPNSQPPVPSVVAALTFTPPPRRAPIVPPQPPNGPNVTPPTAGEPPVINPPPASGNTGGNGGSNGGNGGYRNGGGYGNDGSYNAPPPPGRRSRNNARRHHPNRKPPVTKPNGPKPRHNGGKPGKNRAHPKPVTRGTYLPGGTRVVQRVSPPPHPRGQRLNFVPAAFVKPGPSILSTGLDIVAFIGLLVFSSLALWLCTSEISAITTNSRRLRAHRIAGVTERHWPK